MEGGLRARRDCPGEDPVEPERPLSASGLPPTDALTQSFQSNCQGALRSSSPYSTSGMQIPGPNSFYILSWALTLQKAACVTLTHDISPGGICRGKTTTASFA